MVLWMMDLMLGVTMKEGPVVFGDGLRNTGTEDQGVTVTWVGGSQDEGQDGEKLKEWPFIDWVRTRIVGVKYDRRVEDEEALKDRKVDQEDQELWIRLQEFCNNLVKRSMGKEGLIIMPLALTIIDY